MALRAPLLPPVSASVRKPRISPPFAASFSVMPGVLATAPFFPSTTTTTTLRSRAFNHSEIRTVKASTRGVTPSSDGDEVGSRILETWKVEASSPEYSLLAKLAIALSIAASVTLISVYFKGSPESSFKLPIFMDGTSQPVPMEASGGFTLTAFGYRIIIPEHTPGWVYFWLLMAAGCGLFISEEALNVWVGISLTRSLTLDGSWQSFAQSFSKNSPYIISTILWVYWGVCISDMIPFYLGKLFRQTKASDDICKKLGIAKEKAMNISRVVEKYGNLVGFVERFSLGVRNPTSFLAGALGVSSECFFVGVCCGGLVTLPVQLVIGFLLRERPMVAIASVATAVGVWTVFPYIIAASTALVLFLRQRHSG